MWTHIDTITLEKIFRRLYNVWCTFIKIYKPIGYGICALDYSNVKCGAGL